MNIKLFSIGGYSTWCYYSPARSLFDCGEGCAYHLRNEVFAIENVFISHLHHDHVGGLSGLISARNSARGDKLKPLNIYLPFNEYGIKYISFLKDVFRRLSYSLNFYDLLTLNKDIPVGKDKWVEIFEIKHSRYFKTFGFRVMERRTKLKKEIDPKEVVSLLRSGVNKSDLMVPYHGNLFAYTLDSYHFHDEMVRDAEIWIADCNFLNIADRDEPTHMAFEEVEKIANAMCVKKTVLAHLSSRYNYEYQKKFANDHPNFDMAFHNRVNVF